jgi:DNA-binding IclR family transcriptional regulator
MSKSARGAAYSQLAAAYGAEWPEIRAALDRGIEDYQKMGFCLSEGEWNREVSAVAVPLVLDEGADVMAFSCGGSAQRLTRKVLETKHGPRLRELAAAVKIELAGRGA